MAFIKKYWFMLGMALLVVITVVDRSGTLTAIGRWFKIHHGPDLVIILIFFSSGLALSTSELQAGLKDIQGLLLALVVIFIVAPLVAIVLGLAPLSPGIKIGLFLVAVMPTTLSSGVVMTKTAGGNLAHALFITIVANSLAVFTVPLALGLLLSFGHNSAPIQIDHAALMFKIAVLVILPLAVGYFIKWRLGTLPNRLAGLLPIINQSLILCIIWVALSQSRAAIVSGGTNLIIIVGLTAIFHTALLGAGWGLNTFFGRGPGKKESVLFMGGQKTLPLAIMLQVSLFPQYGIALVFCVLHHVVHLMMDGYIAARLRDSQHQTEKPA
jgi:solute carrier family 10 (sodium/bile acid cotransporter), member 7